MRDPNSGQGGGPETKPRHQFRVQHGVLSSRTLPPAGFGDAWRDVGVPEWETYHLPPSALPSGPVRDYYRWATGGAP